MTRRPPLATRTDSLLPSSTLFLSSLIFSRFPICWSFHFIRFKNRRPTTLCGAGHNRTGRPAIAVPAIQLVDDLTMSPFAEGGSFCFPVGFQSVPIDWIDEIGRASCRERVCQSV